MFKHEVYDLKLNSKIDLPFLNSIKNCDLQQTDLEIEFINNFIPTIKEQINKGLSVDTEGDLILDIPNICFYKITNNQIFIQPYKGVDTQTIANFLVSAAIPYFFAKQGRVILRGCSFTKKCKTANLLLGNSGVGKSTLLAAFAKRDYKILSDQFCILSIENNKVYVQPAFPYIKLWFQATKILKIDSETLLKVRPNLKRFYWKAPFCNEKLEVKHIFKIKEQNLENKNLIEKITGIKKITLLQSCIFGSDLTSLDKNDKINIAKTIIVLATQATFFKVLNIRTKSTIDSLVKLIEDECNEE
ncbi:hypothetical protein EDC55_11350 [Allofrancisella inopinata]|uniref:Serine/threonine protein kinase n=1 Tax=Allofrancisella inopinata TaxID=1085647 RepID=A0AAE7CQC1_9GAMM|nr:serine/threonine protein kinase [Allofrancisella inopinata]QIV95582.1 serine/threonine protein kinase [Allofrancisella inopinata]TDT70729.1 hypothetical protein EDC55_11350 [Allofrancisella inopinata]